MDGDTQAPAPVTLDTIRQQYPQYKDVPDEQLARGLHEKFYPQMSFNDFASKIGYKTEAPADATLPAAPVPGIGSQLLDKAKDVVAPIARGVGALGDVAHRAYQTITGDTPTPYEDPSSLNQRFAAPFQHDPGSTPTIDRAGRMVSAVLPGAAATRDITPVVAPYAAAAGDAVRNSGPAGQTVMADIYPPARDIATGAATLEGAGRIIGRSPITAMADAAGRTAKGVGTLATTLDPEEAANAALAPNAEQAATIQSNPAIERARQAGFQLTGTDVRRAVNGPNDNVPGLTRSRMTDSGTTERIQQNNQALATELPARDVGLKNTKAIDPAEIASRIAEEGKVYDDLGKAVGSKTETSSDFNNDLSRAAAPAASQTSRDAVEQQVQFYQDAYRNGLTGPSAVNDVRHLRQNATKQMASLDSDTQALGRTNLNIANAIENELMRQLPAEAADLRTRFPAARQQLAKLYELQEASQGGQVNPQAYFNLQKAGAPLSGGAAEVAHAASVGGVNGGIGESLSKPITPSTPGLSVGHYGPARTAVNAAGRLVRALPGMDESTEAFQRANYGPFREPTAEEIAAPPPPYEAPEPAPARTPPELRVGEGKATPGRSTARGGPSDYGKSLIEAPASEPSIPPELRVGQGVASTHTPSRPGPAAPLIPEPNVIAPAEIPEPLRVGAGRASPGVSTVRGGPSDYARALVKAPEAPPGPPVTPAELRTGEGSASPSAPSKPGPSGYADLATERPLSEQLAVGSGRPSTHTPTRPGPAAPLIPEPSVGTLAQIPESLRVGAGRASPGRGTRSVGSSGYGANLIENAQGTQSETPKLSDVVTPKTTVAPASTTASPDAQKIRDAYLRLSGNQLKTRVYLSDLRNAVPNMSRDQFDKAVKSISSGDNSPGVLFRQDNRLEITPEIAKGALQYGGENQHILWLDRDLPTNRAAYDAQAVAALKKGKS